MTVILLHLDYKGKFLKYIAHRYKLICICVCITKLLTTDYQVKYNEILNERKYESIQFNDTLGIMHRTKQPYKFPISSS